MIIFGAALVVLYLVFWLGIPLGQASSPLSSHPGRRREAAGTRGFRPFPICPAWDAML